MRHIRVGVVGVGYLGQHHARILSQTEGVHLAAVVDIDENRGAAVARRTGTIPYRDYRDITGKVDAVCVVVPTRLHYVVARYFLEVGKDVLIEKPITDSVYEALELIRIAQESELMLQVGHLERFSAAVARLNEIVRSPYYIESQRLAPFSRRSTDIDVVLDLMIHDIDIILSVVGSKVEHVRAVGHPVLTGNVDIASAWIEFENGCVAYVSASRVSKERLRKIRVFQPDCYISLDYSHQQLSVMRLVVDGEGQDGPTLLEEKHDTKKGDLLKVELEAFVRSIRERQRPLVSGQEGLDALRVALQITQVIRPKVRAINFPTARAAPNGVYTT